jgi:hypothetical protein
VAVFDVAPSIAATVQHVDTTYLPLAPGSGVQADATGGVPDPVRVQCALQAPAKTFGGGVLLPIIASWVGSLITDAVKAAVDARIAEYAAVHTTEPTFGEFDDPTLWTGSADAATSCFMVVQRACQVDADAEDPHCDAAAAPRLVLVGQYRRTPTYLQVRPLYGSVSGTVTRHKKGEPSSVAVSLKLGATWTDNGLGHAATLFEAPLHAEKYVPDDTPHALKITLKDWSALAPLPLPPSSHGSGVHGVTTFEASVADAAGPPPALRAFRKFLDDKGSDVAGVLASALQKLTGRKST